MSETDDPIDSLLGRLDALAVECLRRQRLDVICLLRSDARAPLTADDLIDLWNLTRGLAPEHLVELAVAARAEEADEASDEQRQVIQDYINGRSTSCH